MTAKSVELDDAAMAQIVEKKTRKNASGAI
jgi:hypothetical protein